MSPCTRIEDGAGSELICGAEQLRAFYGSGFDNSPDLHGPITFVRMFP